MRLRGKWRLLAVVATGVVAFGTIGASASAGTIDDLTALFMRYDAPIDLGPTVDDPPTSPIQVVTHDNMKSWKVQETGGALVTFEPNPADCAGARPLGIGTGALHLFAPVGEETAAQLRATRYHNTPLIDLERLDYWACARSNNGQQWPYLILNIDLNDDSQWDFVNDDLIFFEPAYQNASEGGACGAVTAQGPEQEHLWQYWDALDGFNACYWSLKSIGGANPGVNVKPLSVYIAAVEATGHEPAIVNASGNRGGIRLVQGFVTPTGVPPEPPLDGFVDAMTITKKNPNEGVTYDYECGPSSPTPCQ
jgi:hypothetical protein